MDVKEPTPFNINGIQLSENCHDQERSDVGIRQNPLKKRIAAPVCELARNDKTLDGMTLTARKNIDTF